MWVSIGSRRNTTIDNDNQPWWCCTDVSQNSWGHKCHCSSRRYGRLLPIVLVQYNRRDRRSTIYFLLMSAAIDFLLNRSTVTELMILILLLDLLLLLVSNLT
jgi:hypothetical protein